MQQGGVIVRAFGIIAGIAISGLIGIGGVVHALDVADVVREWTPEGKKLAAERAKLPAHDEMVLIPAGSFIMGSDRKIDRNAYPAEFTSGRSIWTHTKSTSPK